MTRLEDAIHAEVPGLTARPRETLGRIEALIRAAAKDGVFQPWTSPQAGHAPKSTMMRGGAHFRKWKLQLFRIAEGTSHPPHCHENLASCLVTLEGRLYVREYDRDRTAETRDWTVLTSAFEGELAPGDSMVTTEDYRNAHWFGAVGGPALAVNFKASGFARFELLRFRNRRYVDPLAGTGPGARTPFISPEAAEDRYAGRIV